jgi:glycosyltransferase A (GT-A) superfamily protein (DUF2064 family)
MARAPRAGECKTRLEPLLGPEGCARLQSALIARAVAWAREIGAEAWIAYTPEDGEEEVAAAAAVPGDGPGSAPAAGPSAGPAAAPPAGPSAGPASAAAAGPHRGLPAVGLFPQRGADLGARLADATARVLAEHDGPLLTIGTDLPTLRPLHAHAALGDLEAGCDASFGPAADGGYYLAAQREPHPELFALPPEEWGGPRVFELTLAAARDAGLALGMLRLEVDLDTPADARLLLLDRALPREIAEILRGAG